MGLWATVLVVLLILWLFFGTYLTYEPQKPFWTVSTTLLPWACVALLTAIVLGGLR